MQEICDGVIIYPIEGKLISLWEMQDVEDSYEINENNNEEGRKETSIYKHKTFEQNCALGSFKKRLKNNLPLVIHASKFTK